MASALPFESAIETAIAEKRVVGAALTAVYKSSDGVKHYSSAFGRESLKADSEPMKLDSLLWIASCTKLLTAISVLQLVQRGLITLNEPLSTVLPEYATPIEVLIPPSDSDGPPTVTTTEEPLTLRRLLTHTSGLCYEWGQSLVRGWRVSLPEDSPYHPSKLSKNGPITLNYRYPLIFPPGAPGKWEYGTSIDWAGKVVERVNGEGLTLGSYMAKYIWEPLGMRSTTFRPLRDSEFTKRLIQRTMRLEDGELAPDPMETFGHVDPHDEGGGGGLYSTAEDYIKVIESLLLDDGKLLPSKLVSELCWPQLPPSPELQARLARNDDPVVLVKESGVRDVADVKWSFSLGGQVALDPIPNKCGPGTMIWSGLPNCFWWLDRDSGTAGFYGSQMFPSADSVTQTLNAQFQKGIYELASRDS
ncbi:Beta-lactamase [Pleurostoma richardsiae]|uniref:Beta-lactamase n=1 Tax=Pleurostoma richardsiae TaxID=41990 RepID=A0AA38RCY2_9PEZI|nr:Beta-lactamase [Pleurostoma richardsiae]